MAVSAGSRPAVVVRRGPALQVLAGPSALRRLRQGPPSPGEVGVVPAAAGGPKGLILGPLDTFLFGHWLPRSPHTVHLLGGSIGAWRMTAACMPDAAAALARLTEDYVTQHYAHAPGQPPTPAHVSEVFGATLARHFAGQEDALLAHPKFRLHVFTSHGRRWLSRETRRWRTGLGYGAAFMANAVSRRALGGWLERVVFSDPREALPVPLDDLPGQQVPLQPGNLLPAVLASCAIPFWLQAVHDIPGGPPGAYWDGGITDYHLHLPYARMPAAMAAKAGQGGSGALVLYPHFQPTLVPGWLDKALKRRHRATSALDNVVVLAPRPEWVAGLPGGKLPDRQDFVAFADNPAERMRRWREAVGASRQLADEWARWVEGGPAPELQPLP